MTCGEGLSLLKKKSSCPFQFFFLPRSFRDFRISMLFRDLHQPTFSRQTPTNVHFIFVVVIQSFRPTDVRQRYPPADVLRRPSAHVLLVFVFCQRTSLRDFRLLTSFRYLYQPTSFRDFCISTFYEDFHLPTPFVDLPFDVMPLFFLLMSFRDFRLPTNFVHSMYRRLLDDLCAAS